MSGLKDQIKSLKTELATMTNQATVKRTEIEAKGGDGVSADDVAMLNKLIDDGFEKRQKLERLERLQANEEYLNQPAEAAKAVAGRAAPQRKTWGELVLESQQFKQADKHSTVSRMDPVNVKALYATDDSAGGLLVQVDRQPEVLDIPQRPPSILDMITVVNTTSDAIEYAELAARTNNAAPVPERAGGAFGLKPESNLEWALRSAVVKTIATWVPASRRILADAPGLRTIVDVELTAMLRVELEDQVIGGDGQGENFLGILNTPGILTRTQGAGARSAAGDTVADTIHRAITDIVLEFYTPNGIVLNPTDAETMALAKGTDGHYVEIFDAATGRLWRTAVATTAALPAKTALVGDLLLAARMWDRQQTEIRVGEPNDFFLRNAVAVLAELRAAFALIRKRAIEKVTLT